MEWYKKQNSELVQYKSQFNLQNSKVEQLSEEINSLKNAQKITEEKFLYVNNLTKVQNEKIDKLKNARDIYKNAFNEGAKRYDAQVKGKTLKELLNFNTNFEEA
jgi:hypothetical protein